jgi:ubiquinone/menaquinone biosynthesis C-methylase UbiE
MMTIFETGNTMSSWVGLERQITLKHGNALSMSFENNSFDGAYMLHIGMNIEDKIRLFSEISRLLRPGSIFGIYDIMRNLDGELTYPVPWASDHNTSKLVTATEYIQALQETGFNVISEYNCCDFALDFFKNLQAKIEANGGPPPLGLHTLMKESTPVKLKNMVDGIAADYIAPVEIITQKTN